MQRLTVSTYVTMRKSKCFFSVGIWAASCKKLIRKNKLTRKSKSTRIDILYLKIQFFVDLFFLVNLFFLIDFLHEEALNISIDIHSLVNL